MKQVLLVDTLVQPLLLFRLRSFETRELSLVIFSFSSFIFAGSVDIVEDGGISHSSSFLFVFDWWPIENLTQSLLVDIALFSIVIRRSFGLDRQVY